ncbi:MAG: hypothetical protein WAV32_10450 [Halobacteriota archaeon]
MSVPGPILYGALVISWVIIGFLYLKLMMLRSEFEMLQSQGEVTEEELEQLERDIEWLTDMKKEGFFD